MSILIVWNMDTPKLASFCKFPHSSRKTILWFFLFPSYPHPPTLDNLVRGDDDGVGVQKIGFSFVGSFVVITNCPPKKKLSSEKWPQASMIDYRNVMFRGKHFHNLLNQCSFRRLDEMQPQKQMKREIKTIRFNSCLG